MGLEATAPLEAPTQPPAAETAPCKHGYGNTRCPHGCNDYTAPAPALCQHSWVEEENEADQLQTACEKCGATKPAPETAKCPNLPGHETHSPPCGLDYSILHPKHSATAKAGVGKESKMGLEATAPLEAPTQPPAAEN